MKVLFVVPALSRIGGLSRSQQRLAGHLAQAGVRVEVVGPPGSQEGAQAGRHDFNGQHFRNWTQQIIEYAEKTAPEVIVGFYGSTAGFCAVAAAAYLGTPSVCCLRGSDVNRDFFSSLSASALQFAVAGATRVTVVSTEMQRKVKAWLGRDAVFIANGVDKSLFYPDAAAASRFRTEWGLDPDRDTIGLFGEFKDVRGLELLPELAAAFGGKQLVLVGTVRSEYRKIIPEWVRLIPYQEDVAQLRGAYSACALVLQPSRYDGMPNVVLEAMACGCVVAGAPVGGMTDVIRPGRNGYLCRTVEEWAACLAAEKAPAMRQFARDDVPAAQDEARALLELLYSLKPATQR